MSDDQTTSARSAGSPRRTFFPASQELPVLGTQRPRDRLQGREDVAAIPVRARENRTEPDQRCLCAEAAAAGPRDQAGPYPGAAPVRDSLRILGI